MSCDTRVPQGMTPIQRRQQIQAALKELEAQLKARSASIVVGPNGAVAFKGWRNGAAVSDACAFRVLQSQGSWELRQAVARAEAMSGKKVNVQTVASGTHSHDGGKTWGKD